MKDRVARGLGAYANTAAGISAAGGALQSSILALGGVLQALPAALEFPETDFPISIFSSSTGGMFAGTTDDLDRVDPRLKTSVVYHIDPVSGNNSNTGIADFGDWSNAVLSPSQAIDNFNASPYTTARFLFRADTQARTDGYHQGRSINSTSGTVEPTKPFAMFGWGGTPYLCARTTLTWSATPDPTYTNCYTATLGSCDFVGDRLNLTDATINPDTSAQYVGYVGPPVMLYTRLNLAADPATCDSTPGSWVISGGLIYVHRSDGIAVTEANTRVLRNLTVSAFQTCTSPFHIENIHFEGGTNGAMWVDPPAERNINFINCTARYGGREAQQLDGFRIRRTKGFVVLKGCDGSGNYKDGINFHWDRHTVSSITRSGAVATLTTTGLHGLTTGDLISVTGATQAEYNVTNAACTVISTTAFTYAVSGSPATPATGSPVLITDPLTWAITINCTGFYNGNYTNSAGTASSCNGLTPHDNYGLIDIGGQYGGNSQGAEFHSVEYARTACFGTKVWATSRGGGGVNGGFKVSNASRLWLYGTTAYAEVGERALYAQTAASTQVATIFKNRHRTIQGLETKDTFGVIEDLG